MNDVERIGLSTVVQQSPTCSRLSSHQRLAVSVLEFEMQKFHISLITAILAATIGVANAASPAHGVVYSANEGDGSISAITLSSGEVRTVDIPVVPHNVQISLDGKFLLAVGPPSEGHGGHGGVESQSTPAAATHGHGAQAALVLLDASKPGELIATLPSGDHPAHVVTSKGGDLAFITNADANQVTVVDISRKAVVAEIPTGSYPHGLRLSPDGRELYVANVTDNSVSVIDAENLKESARIPVGKAPVQVAFTPNGAQVYVSLRDENSVAVIDTGTREVTGKIQVGRNPIQLFSTPDGRKMYVANQGSDSDPDNTVSVIDIGTQRVVDTVTTGMGAHGVVASDDGKWVFITNNKADTVSAIDTATQAVVGTYKVGSAPNGITYRALP